MYIYIYTYICMIDIGNWILTHPVTQILILQYKFLMKLMVAFKRTFECFIICLWREEIMMAVVKWGDFGTSMWKSRYFRQWSRVETFNTVIEVGCCDGVQHCISRS